ncbi:MAG: fumarylacetoacetate hydrolase family protein [Burkholderiales bacterium]|nr:fumarylacetoacetate hydrolase family protein [Burkholderiales bacterium]
MPTPLSADAIDTAARILLARRHSGQPGARLPAECRPSDLASALAIQQSVSELMQDEVAAWKCGMPAADKWVLAPIYARSVQRGGQACAVWTRNNLARIEPELAFVLGQDLPARAAPYTPSEVDAAIARTHLALELIDTRYSEPEQASFAEHLADGLFNQGLYLGPVVDGELARRCAGMDIVLSVAGEPDVLWAGQHPAGNPRAPLYWLAEFLRNRGQGLRAGQAVITGSYAGSPDVPLNTKIKVRFGALGDLRAAFTARTQG